ncbi:Double-stranded DNA-binding domain protein [Trichinella nativa]|uniref:Double-stranded DNA-binding domain protein n=5 Tax=Trichinella TaxID=6333 RepID=A0A1Y3E913_9BILA|nr:Double-stranded DNA-binding domain protein [Trichinella nativa]
MLKKQTKKYQCFFTSISSKIQLSQHKTNQSSLYKNLKIMNTDQDGKNSSEASHHLNSSTERDKVEEAQKAKEREQELRNSLLTQVLEQDALARLNTLAKAKPEKAKIAENSILNFVRFGGANAKITDEKLKELLETINEKVTSEKVTVKFRRKGILDSDSEEDF